MISTRPFRANLTRVFTALLLCVVIAVPDGLCQDTEDSQIFIAGFNAYRDHDFATTIARMDEVLKKYPETTLRDMALFWLSRAHYKSGHRRDAARVMSQFTREYPNSPLKGTAEEELIALAAANGQGEQLSAPEPTTGQPLAGKPQSEELEKAEEERVAAEKAKQEQLAREKAEQERVATKKAKDAEAARVAVEKAEKDRRAALLAEQRRQERIKAEREHVAAEKAQQEQLAREKAEQEHIAAKKAKDAEVARMAAEKAEKDRRAALLAEQQRQERIKAERERIATEKAKQEQLAREKAEQEHIAAKKAKDAEAAQMAAEKAEKDRREALLAEQRRQERIKAERERVATEKAKQEQLAREKAEQERVAAEKTRLEKTLLREKAIAQYKTVIRDFPGTKAAATAASKLRGLGVITQPTSQMAITDSGRMENEQVFKLEVAQFAALNLMLPATSKTFDTAKRTAIPFEITNQGNGNDYFNLESGFPVEYAISFAAATAPGQTITRTPSLLPGETFRGLIQFTIPATSIDGLRISYPIKAVSNFMGEVTQSGEIHMTTTAPLLRAIVKTDKTSPAPGENLLYRVTLLNIGSTVARDVSLRLGFPPQLEPLEHASSSLEQDGQSAMVMDGISLKPGESKEFTVTFRLRDDSLAGQEMVCRAELIDHKLKTSATFVSNAANVKPVRGILVRPVSERIAAIPGQTVTASFVVTNTGNGRDTFRITPDVKGTGDAIVFHDLNRDGVKQPNEPVISEVGPLEPKEEASIVMEIKTIRNAADKGEGTARITFVSLGDASRSASGSSSLTYSRPVLQMTMTGGNGRLRPGDVASFDLLITNRGSNLAKTVELRSTWPEQLELVAAEPASDSMANGKIFWRFKELGAGEKRSIKVSFRVKKGIGAGASIQVKNLLNYEDQLGNRY